MKSFGLYIAMIVILFGCRELPSVDKINELDPFSPEYNPIAPTLLPPVFDPSFDVIRITWEQERDELEGIIGYEVYVSTSDTNSFELRERIPTTNSTEYMFEEDFNSEVFTYLFRVRAYFEQLDGTVYSDFASTEYLGNLPQVFSQVWRHPFAAVPQYKIDISVIDPRDLSIEVFLETLDSPPTSIYTTEFSPFSYVNIWYPLDVNADSTKLYYKLFTDSFESGLIPFNQDDILADLSKALDLVSLSTSSIELNLTDADTTWDLNFQKTTTIYDNYELTVTRSNEEVVFSNENLLFENPVVLQGLNSYESYFTSFRGKRGVYTSNQRNRSFRVTQQIDKQTSFDINYPGADGILVDIDTTNSLYFASSTTSPYNILIDPSNGEYEVSSYSTSSTKRIGKFPPFNLDFNSSLYIADSDLSIVGWEIENLLMTSKNEGGVVPTFSMLATDFDFYDDHSIIYLSRYGSNTQNLYITVYNFETESHDYLFGIENVEGRTARILYNESKHQVFVFFRDLNGNGNLEYVVYDIGSNTISNTYRLRDNNGRDLFVDEQFNIKVGENGAKIHLYDFQIHVIIEANFPFDHNQFDSITRIDNTAASESSEFCVARGSQSQSNNNFSITCYSGEDQQQYLEYFEQVDDRLLAIDLNADASIMYLLFSGELRTFNFKKEWIFD
ncbi:MAG: hypothetical protein ED557_14225 [Balneola sp.]|nr:MAG: hypothetical protein ED557_14225 [Balneola sp.]